MFTINTVDTRPIYDYTPPAPSPYKDIIWDIVSAILFPIGLYRITSYLLGKYVVSQLLLPSSSFVMHKWFPPEELNTPFAITLETSDGIKLDSVKIKHQNLLAPSEERWIVCILGNEGRWQNSYNDLLFLAHHTALNVLCINPRGVGNSTYIHPSSFEDLFSDVDTGVLHLLNEGVLSNNIVLHGHSLGGASALHVASRRGLAAIAQNTFAKVDQVIPHHLNAFAEITSDFLNRLSTVQQNPAARDLLWLLLFSAKDLLFSLPHLAIRVTYFFFSMLENLVCCEFKEAIKDLMEIGKTLFIDTVLTITGFISLIALPFTKKVHALNGTLNSFFLERAALPRVLASPKTAWLAKQLLTCTGWNADNYTAASRLRNVFVMHPTEDHVIPYTASLPVALRDGLSPHTLTSYDLHPDADHNTIILPAASSSNTVNKALATFLEEVLAIKFTRLS